MTGSFTLYGFQHEAEPRDDLRRTRLPSERVGVAVEWAVGRGAQYVLIQHIADEEPFGELLIHHLCNDPDCPGGCVDVRRGRLADTM